MTNVSVVGGSASTTLAMKIAKKLKANYIKTELRTFPDGESKITFESKPKKGRIIIVQSTHPPVDSNLIQALAMVSKAKEFSSDITLVAPYFGYARQDREFLPGEIVTMEVIAKLLKEAGASKLVVIDIHSVLGLSHFKIPTKNVTAIPELAKSFKKLKLKKPLVVSPDAGGKTRAEEFAELIESDIIALEKHRDRKTGKVKITSQQLGDIKGRDIILVDDMISTGGSIIKAAQFLKKQHCNRIFVTCTHALLIDNAGERIKKAGVSKIISTNTVPGKTGVVDVSGIIAQALL